MRKFACITLVLILVLSSISFAFADNDKDVTNTTATAVWSSILHDYEGDTREIQITLTGVIGKQIDNNRVAFEEYKVKYLDKLANDTDYVHYEYAKPVWNGVGDLDENAIKVIPVMEGATLTVEVRDAGGRVKLPMGSYPIIDEEKSIICNSTAESTMVTSGKVVGFSRKSFSFYQPFIYEFPIHIEGQKYGIIVLSAEDKHPVPGDDIVDAIKGSENIDNKGDESKVPSSSGDDTEKPVKDTVDNEVIGLSNFKEVKEYTSTTFNDIKESDWFSKDVKNSYSLGIMNGMGDDKFNPKGNIKVSEAIVMVSRTKDIFIGNSGKITSTGQPWYNGYVKYAIDNKIITEGQFESYDRNITRAELAFLFANAIDDNALKAINKITKIPDVREDLQYSNEIFKLYNAGIVTGSDSLGTFYPTKDITRAEASVIINRVIKTDNRKSLTLK